MIFLYISITIKEEDTDFSFFKCFLFMNALQYMDAYDYRMNLGKLKKEVNNIILIYGLCDMVNRAMTLVKYFTPNFGTEYYDVLYGCFCRHRKMTDMEIMLELGMSRASFYRKKKAALRYMGYYFFEQVWRAYYYSWHFRTPKKISGEI